jgi:hypothetical protein
MLQTDEDESQYFWKAARMSWTLSAVFTSGRLIFHQPIKFRVGGTAGCGCKAEFYVIDRNQISNSFNIPDSSHPTPQFAIEFQTKTVFTICPYCNTIIFIHCRNYALQVNIHPAGPRFVDSHPDPSLVSQRHRRLEPPEPQLKNPAFFPIQHLESLQLTPIPLLQTQLTSKPQPWPPAAHLQLVP